MSREYLNRERHKPKHIARKIFDVKNRHINVSETKHTNAHLAAFLPRKENVSAGVPSVG